MTFDNTNNVTDAFNAFLDEIEAQIGLTEKASARAIEQHDYDQARGMLERAGQLAAFRERVTALRVDWDKIPGLPTEKEDTTVAPAHPAESFRGACLARIEKKLKTKLTKKSVTSYVTADGKAVVCVVSSEYTDVTPPRYWFAFHPYQVEFLESTTQAYLALGCGSSDRVLLIPYQVFRQWLDSLNTTDRHGEVYWHIHILKLEDRLALDRTKGCEDVDVTEYLLR